MERIRALLVSDNEEREALRKLGGLLLGVGFVVVFFRRSSLDDPWGNFGLFLALAIPCVFLYGNGLLAHMAAGRARPWEAVYFVFGILLLPLALGQFVELIGGNRGAPLNVAWIFLLTAAAAAWTAFFARVRFALLLASLAVIVSWLALWDELLTDGIFGELDTLRALLIVVAVLLLAFAFALRFTDFAEEALERGNEIVTAAGLTLVAAGALSLAIVVPLISAQFGAEVDPAAEPSVFWDSFLLVVSLALIGWGTRFGVRGPAYVGAIGLVLFAYIVGFDLDQESREGKILGWPLLLIVLGAASFVASLMPGLKLSAARREDSEPPPPPPPSA
jgi:hypothetical protein